MDLSGSSVIVTGGASGLGAATARVLAKATRCHVVIADLQEDLGGELAAEVEGSYIRTDILRSEDVIRAIDVAAAEFPLRGLVNCAGGGVGGRTIGRDGSYDSAHSLESFVRTITLNVVGTFNMIRLCATAMSRNEAGPDGDRGAVVNTASVAAYEGQIGQVAYAAAKAAIVGMTLPVARDLAAAGIRINTIAPGTFATPPMLGVPEGVLASLAAATPFPKRLGEPSEFGELALALLSNSYLNGETVRLDGAIRMQPK